MSSAVSVTRRKRSDCWPTKPAIHVPGPSERTVSTSIGSLNSGPVRICPSWIAVSALTGNYMQILESAACWITMLTSPSDNSGLDASQSEQSSWRSRQVKRVLASEAVRQAVGTRVADGELDPVRE